MEKTSDHVGQEERYPLCDESLVAVVKSLCYKGAIKLIACNT